MNSSTILNGYLATAIWAELDHDVIDEHGNSSTLDENYHSGDFTDKARIQASLDCGTLQFIMERTSCKGYVNLWEAAIAVQDIDSIGHDFWLTRNGHGAGFWDGDYGDYGDAITKIVDDNFSEVSVHANGQGELDFE